MSVAAHICCLCTSNHPSASSLFAHYTHFPWCDLVRRGGKLDLRWCRGLHLVKVHLQTHSYRVIVDASTNLTHRYISSDDASAINQTKSASIVQESSIDDCFHFLLVQWWCSYIRAARALRIIHGTTLCEAEIVVILKTPRTSSFPVPELAVSHVETLCSCWSFYLE
jgi:hypothetical protein